VEVPDGLDPHLVSLLNPIAFEAEQYRTLCHMVEQMRKDTDPYMVAVSSPAIGDGKTLTAINLAVTLAQSPEARVLLVDADLRRPSVSRQLGLGTSSNPGLGSTILDPSLSLEDVVRPYPPFNLAVLPAGRSLANPYEALKSPRLGELLEEARQRYDYIVLDTPPLVPFPDCRLLERWINGFLVVVTAHKTPRKLVEEALNLVDPAKMIGLVFNSDDHPVFGYYSYYAYGPPSNNGSWMGRLGRAVKKVGSSLRHQRSSP
jgi:capsular exopolysaccharide synthesis family protein